MVQEYSPKDCGLFMSVVFVNAADLAGSMRLQYPPEVRILMVPCTGRVDLIHLLKASS